MESVKHAIEAVSAFVWGPWCLVPLLLAADFVGNDANCDEIAARSAGQRRRTVGGENVELSRRGIVGAWRRSKR